MFRGKYLDGLQALLEQQQLDLPPQLAALSEAAARRAALRRRNHARKPREIASRNHAKSCGRS
jgi:hypothetical protein